MVKFSKKFTPFAHSSLVRQVVILAFAWSFAIFILVSAFTSYQVYTGGEKSILSEVNYLEKVIETPLRNALWGVDIESTQTILKVLSNNPNIASASITYTDGKIIESKTDRKADWVKLEFPLIHHRFSNGDKKLGVLVLTLSRDQFNKNLVANIISNCLENLGRFLLLVVCIVFIFNKKIIQPLTKIHVMTKKFNNEQLTPILGGSLGRSENESSNEIESLYKDIHVLQENFKLAFKLQQEAKEANHVIELALEKEKQKLLLSQRLETIGQITSQVAHDFGNLIMIINGKTKSLDKNLSNPADLKQTEAIRKATTRAHSLIKKILSMTRAQKAESVIFDPYTNLIEIQDLLKISIGGNILLNIETDSSAKLIEVEPSSYENVIINLCVNARDAMPEGGTIVIGIKTVIKDNCDYVAISVEDNGEGIPLDIQSKIFDPFFTTKSEGKGTGLGLSQVQEFVKNVGGTLELSSKKEATCFTLYLPNKASAIESSAA